jgi:hypothetical protein
MFDENRKNYILKKYNNPKELEREKIFDEFLGKEEILR